MFSLASWNRLKAEPIGAMSSSWEDMDVIYRYTATKIRCREASYAVFNQCIILPND
jgi:hypothetical protein